MPCRHPDVRKFDGIRCCLACGEAVFESTTPTRSYASSDTTYQYQKLNYALGQEIRLIELLPGEFSDTVRCRMLHVNLEDDPAYEAVSYTWATETGDATKCKVIHFADGHGSIIVTQNCEAALRQLRLRGCARRLWVDAICIDQTNTSERNHQVGFMDRVFSQAWRVVICIQDSDTQERVRYPALFEVLRKEGIVDTMNSRALDRLLNLRYFERVWVIQEVALARFAYLRINDQELLLTPSILATFQSFCSKHNRQIPGALRWIPGQRSEYDILTCLAAGHHCKATDPRDLVFALLSLMEPRARAFIPADYSLDLRSVYAYALIAVVAASRSLSILRHTKEGTQLSLKAVLSDQLNTYAQFNHKTGSAWQSAIHVRVTDDTEDSLQELGARMPSTVTFEKPGTVNLYGDLPPFRVRAQYLDTITNSRFCSDHGTRRVFQSYGNSCEPDDRSHMPLYRPKAESTLQYGGHYECHCSTTVFLALHARNLIQAVSHATEATAMGRFSWIVDYFRTDLQPLDILDATERDREVKLRDGAISSVSLADMAAFMSQTAGLGEELQPLRSLDVFTTQYSIGCAKNDFRLGDEIFAIDGVGVPLILRRVKSQHVTDQQQYNVVGECYLWAALELDRWDPGTRKGRWLNDYSQDQHPNEAGGQTRMIRI